MQIPEEEQKPAGRGRPSIRTDEIIERILDGLSNGTPLTLICAVEGMPGITTVWEWQKADAALSERIARAREAGFDQIAMDALAIADNVDEQADSDTIHTDRGMIPNKEWMMRSKLRVDTRLKLLSKWDPKRYGDKITQEISGPDGSPLRNETTITPELEQRIIDAVEHAAKVKPPGMFRGQEAE